MTHSSRHPRKRSPGVYRGKVKNSDRVVQTPSYWNTSQPYPVVDREKPGKGFRHFLTRSDIFAFVGILPEWEEVSKGLDGVLLSSGEKGVDGWHTRSIVAISAWERECWRVVPVEYYHVHKYLLGRLKVPCLKQGREYQCRFTPSQIRAFQLLHVFLHELGHHHDRMTTKSRKESSRGELFAEHYALKYGERVWDRYMDVFGL
ncbi:MAG: hypothetical protein ACLFVQ_11245 [Chitinispirillaceae bacterium]